MNTSRECQRIITEYKNGNTEILNELPPIIDKMIYSIIHKYTKHMSLDDLYQVAWESIMESISNYRLDQNTLFTSYAYTGINYKCLNLIRKENRLHTVSLQTDIKQGYRTVTVQDTVPAKETTENLILNNLRMTEIDNYIEGTVAEKQQQMLTMYIEGYAQSEIANKLGVTPAYVSKTLKTFRQLNKNIIGD